MKKLEITPLNSLFHTNWHPERGDYVKENSMKEGEILGNRLRRYKVAVWLLSSVIVTLFAVSIFLLSV